MSSEDFPLRFLRRRRVDLHEPPWAIRQPHRGEEGCGGLDAHDGGDVQEIEMARRDHSETSDGHHGER